ncbi:MULTISPECIES: hypothetical protein [Agrobacterium tumefaciens complex]|uniref:Peptidylprolyl isomerase n=1 Tax=Agrobacterium tumefaciens TaxID=358 RepID=A0AAW8M297_AGRTU|nr:hypothetical protein [Agrobacterium tumefaciens]MBP2568425.1 hypothetical protein [Agrobacterium tumefaciens]MDP9857313.1 hypothetical protein [Agrobacterium tumefaciens]MDP9874325.1 hypothetical protein [Agrobacterium tumefaciens]MDP9978922.1 hypothetical protein [Agrobacterium tumefaciens]MDR6705452.1 hypothetical protein [Agrobacterium tumefaciens]
MGYLFIVCSYDAQESSEEYYTSISDFEDSKRNQARTGKRNFAGLLGDWVHPVAGMEAGRHNVLKIFVLNSPNDEATEIKAAPS